MVEVLVTVVVLAEVWPVARSVSEANGQLGENNDSFVPEHLLAE